MESKDGTDTNELGREVQVLNRNIGVKDGTPCGTLCGTLCGTHLAAHLAAHFAAQLVPGDFRGFL